RSLRDWSSDVCSSDLDTQAGGEALVRPGPSAAAVECLEDSAVRSQRVLKRIARREIGGSGPAGDVDVTDSVAADALSNIQIAAEIGRASCRGSVEVQG